MATIVLAMPEFISTVPSTSIRSKACKSFDTPRREGTKGERRRRRQKQREVLHKNLRGGETERDEKVR